MSFFRAISSFFSNTTDDRHPVRTARREQALSSTRDAFSLPQHSPSLRNSFSRRSSAESPLAFTYPPRPSSHEQGRQSSERADGSRSVYMDGMNELQSPNSSRRSGHLLPLHQNPASPVSAYPSLQHTWTRLQTWLSNEFTELGDTLNYGVLPDTLANVENQLGVSLPPAVRESYLVVDGQEPESSSGCSEGLFFGLTLLPLEDVLAEWSFWREVDRDPSTGANEQLRAQMRSIPPNWVRQEYSCRGWLPLVTDRTGNYLGVDLDPAEGGTRGQVIIFGRDFDTKIVMYRGEGEGGWAKWLASFVEDLESGIGYDLTGQQSDGGSDGSDDNAGYEGYFFNPSGGARGHGGADGGQTMRLGGDYKGWSVLEAWADRSMRAWAEMGLVLDEIDGEVQQAPPPGIGLGVLAMQGSTAAEIPIPVLGEEEAAQLSTSTPMSEAGSSKIVFTGYNPASTAQPPPPQPIELPTRSDLSNHVFLGALLEESSERRLTENSAELGLSSYVSLGDRRVQRRADGIELEPAGEVTTSTALLSTNKTIVTSPTSPEPLVGPLSGREAGSGSSAKTLDLSEDYHNKGETVLLDPLDSSERTPSNTEGSRSQEATLPSSV